MIEETQNINFPVPVSLRDTMLKQMEEKGVEVTNQRIINALKFAFTDNVIPFADEYDDESQWATKEDVETLMKYISESKHQICKQLEALNTIANILGFDAETDKELVSKE